MKHIHHIMRNLHVTTVEQTDPHGVTTASAALLPTYQRKQLPSAEPAGVKPVRPADKDSHCLMLIMFGPK